ncbi:MAG: hypothetical protein QXX52_08085 [Ignisphaera sp.]
METNDISIDERYPKVDEASLGINSLKGKQSVYSTLSNPVSPPLGRNHILYNKSL